GRWTHLRRSLGADEHMDLYTSFPRAQLLERRSAFQRTADPLHELPEGVPPKTVYTLMTKRQRAALALFGGLHADARSRLEWNRGAREIEGVSGKIDNHFDLVSGQRVFSMLKPMRRSDHLNSRVRAKFRHDLVD